MLNQDYKDILSAFSEAGVRYLLVGAYAIAAHGQVRATGDIDLWVDSDRGNAPKVMEALRMFGAPIHEIRQGDFEKPDVVFQIGVAPCRIDILTSIDAVEFPEAWENRGEVRVAGFIVPVIGRPELIKKKLATGRPKDRADAMSLQED